MTLPSDALTEPGSRLRGLFARRRPSSAWDLPGQVGAYGQEVVDETSHREGIATVLRGVRVNSRGVKVFAKASLVPEPRTRRDPLAVAVEVHGQTLGYLPRDDAATYQPTLLAAIRAGRVPRVNACIYARLDPDAVGGRVLSVRVDLAALDVITAT